MSVTGTICSINVSDRNYLEGSIDSLFKNVENSECERRNKSQFCLRHHGKCTKPYVKVRDYPDLPIGDKEREGILTDRMIEVCSCCLEETAVPGKYALGTCVLERKGLTSIQILGFHQFLKRVDLSRNRLESVEILGKLPFLEYLDVSHNLLTRLVEFQAPFFLTYLNYSWNLIEEMVDLENFWSLVSLNLSHNLIGKIFGLKSLKYLKHLDMSYNKIERLENFGNLGIKTLHLDFNNISSFECNPNSFLKLINLTISNNYLDSLEFLKELGNIESINLTRNNIKDLVELAYLRNMPFLLSLNLQGNPIEGNPKFKKECLKSVQRLGELNGVVISPEEKAHIEFSLGTNPHLQMYKINYHKPPEIDSTVMTCYQKLAFMLLFVGPVAAKMKNLITGLLAANPKYSKRSVSHTTRTRAEYEVGGRDYHFVSVEEFKRMMLNGEFLSCSHKFGYSYGLSYSELRKVSEDIGILLINCDMNTALQLKAKFMNCKMVLVLPKTEQSHKERLREKYETTPWLREHLRAYLLIRKATKTEEKPLVECTPAGVQKVDEIPESRSNTLFENIVPILRCHSMEIPKKGQQSVAFVKDTNFPSEEKITSVSQTLLTNEDQFALSSLSKKHIYATFVESDEEIDPRSASTAVMDTNSTILASVSKHTNSPKKKANFHNKEVPLKHSVRQSGEFLNATVYTSISQQIEVEDEYIMSVLLSKTEMGNSDSSESKHSNEEVHTGMSEEDDNLLMRFFVESQMMRRRKYLELYEKNPGLFLKCVKSDSYEEAYPAFKDALKSCVDMQRKCFVKTQCTNLYPCKEMRDERLKALMDQIR